jgi:hypothetical protein
VLGRWLALFLVRDLLLVKYSGASSAYKSRIVLRLEFKCTMLKRLVCRLEHLVHSKFFRQWNELFAAQGVCIVVPSNKL